jgi:hypothetical protein
MRFIRSFVLGTLILLTFCSVLVIRQFQLNETRHVEMRESFLLLVKKGYNAEATKLYERLLLKLGSLPDKTLIEDLQRAAMVVDPAKTQTENLVWRFYWNINNELEKRAEARLAGAVDLVETK